MKITITAILLLTAGSLLSACDSKAPSPKARSDHLVRGVVFNEEGPVTKGRLEATDSRSAIVGKTELNGDSHYTIKLPPGSAYPVVITAYPAQGEPLKAVVTNDLVEEQDVSDVTSLVVDAAINLGGLTDANLAKAAGAAISQRKSSGGTGSSTGFKGDPTKQYGGWH
jgi:hypothetical protein